MPADAAIPEHLNGSLAGDRGFGEYLDSGRGICLEVWGTHLLEALLFPTQSRMTQQCKNEQ